MLSLGYTETGGARECVCGGSHFCRQDRGGRVRSGHIPSQHAEVSFILVYSCFTGNKLITTAMLQYLERSLHWLSWANLCTWSTGKVRKIVWVVCPDKGNAKGLFWHTPYHKNQLSDDALSSKYSRTLIDQSNDLQNDCGWLKTQFSHQRHIYVANYLLNKGHSYSCRYSNRCGPPESCNVLLVCRPWFATPGAVTTTLPRQWKIRIYYWDLPWLLCSLG